MTGQALIVQGDALHLPLPDASVDLIVTSPPYAFLRAYDIGYPHLEVGAEATPAEFLEHLWQATAEMVRVLKSTGSIFVDLGDKYSGNEKGTPWTGRALPNDRTIGGSGYGNQNVGQSRPQYRSGIPNKSLMLLPERYRIGCVDQLGLIARAVIVWQKPNGLPESVVDRVRRSHEDWVHLVKQPRYYSAIDEVRESYSPSSLATYAARGLAGMAAGGHPSATNRREEYGRDGNMDDYRGNPLGKLPGSVWTIGGSIWDGPIRFCPRCGRDLTAGNGRAGERETVTVSSGSPESATNEPTVLPTNSGSASSPPASPSTTFAVTEDVSGPTTLSPSPASRTSPEATPPQSATAPRPTATTGTSSPPPRPTPGLEVVESARCVCEIGCEPDVPGSVWSVPSEPLRLPDHLGVQHYAAFPSEWPRRLILGWSPPGICLDCRQGRIPVVDKQAVKSPVHSDGSIVGNRDGGPDERGWDGLPRFNMSATILGYACACTPHTNHPGSGERQTRDYQPMPDARPQGTYGRHQAGEYQPVGPWREYHLDGWRPPPTRPAVVLDCFSGTGTVPMVARALDRIGIGVDLSFPYCRAARWRVHHDADKAISRTNLERQGSLL